MLEEKLYTAMEAHRLFAINLNNEVWELLEKPSRTREENDRMICAAHASCCHWLEVGSVVNHQRGEWLISRVYSVLGFSETALYHAQRCLELTETNFNLMRDFDIAFAYEGMARAYAVAGNASSAREYTQKASAAGKKVMDEEDKNVFLVEFNQGNWHGVR